MSLKDDISDLSDTELEEYFAARKKEQRPITVDTVDSWRALSRLERAVLRAVIRNRNTRKATSKIKYPTYVSRIGGKQFEKETGYDRRTVLRAVASLEEKGILEVLRDKLHNKAGSGRKHENAYLIRPKQYYKWLQAQNGEHSEAGLPAAKQ